MTAADVKRFAGAYATLTVVLTAFLLVLGARAAEKDGLHRQVFPDVGFRGAPLLDDISNDATLDFLEEEPTLPRRFFSARWQGFWYLPEATDLELHGEGDDRLDVWVDDELVIRRTPPSDMHLQATALTLRSGIHRIRVEYEQHAGAHALRLLWSPPNGRPRALPSHYFFHQPPDEDDIRLAERAALLRRSVLFLWGAPLTIGVLWVAARRWARHRATAANVRARHTGAPSHHDKLGIALASAVYALTIGVFIKNAWVTEDAYIIFRSVEQVFAGNGPVWNPHERVQAFTSPLWFGVLVLTRIVSSNLYLNTIVVSFALWLLAVRNLQLLAPNRVAFALGVLLCIASSALHDYSSSGLENALAFALIATFLLEVVRLHRDTPRPANAFRHLFRASVVFGLIAVTRHDLVPLVLPPAVFLVWSHRSVLSARQSLALAVAATLPLAAWTLFSLVYYGFPWPNTAYAKLNTGIERADLVLQGLRYVQVSFQQDPITPVTIVAALLVTLFRARHTVYRFVGLGVLLNLSYVVWIGGDFMAGRFFSYSYLVAVILLMLQLPRVTLLMRHNHSLGNQPTATAQRQTLTAAVLAGTAVAAYAVAFHHTPLNCWQPSLEHGPEVFGIQSERAHYPDTSLRNYLSRDPEVAIWPYHYFARFGLELFHSPERVHVAGGIGMTGYVAGTDKIIVDYYALADPLLARLPVRDPEDWRIGHFRRIVPAGYTERLGAIDSMHADLRAYGVSDSASELDRLTFLSHLHPITPANLNELYRRLTIVTQTEDLWSAERLKTILLFNLGAYDRLMEPH